MPLNAAQLAHLQAWIHSQYDLKKKVDGIMEILLGDFFAEPPSDLWKALETQGISREQFDQMNTDEQISAVCEVSGRRHETRSDQYIAVLDMILGERFGWAEGTVKDMTIRDLFLAMEHATEWDNPSKPTIWDITK